MKCKKSYKFEQVLTESFKDAIEKLLEYVSASCVRLVEVENCLLEPLAQIRHAFNIPVGLRIKHLQNDRSAMKQTARENGFEQTDYCILGNDHSHSLIAIDSLIAKIELQVCFTV